MIYHYTFYQWGYLWVSFPIPHTLGTFTQVLKGLHQNRVHYSVPSSLRNSGSFCDDAFSQEINATIVIIFKDQILENCPSDTIKTFGYAYCLCHLTLDTTSKGVHHVSNFTAIENLSLLKPTTSSSKQKVEITRRLWSVYADFSHVKKLPNCFIAGGLYNWNAPSSCYGPFFC